MTKKKPSKKREKVRIGIMFYEVEVSPGTLKTGKWKSATKKDFSKKIFSFGWPDYLFNDPTHE